MLKRFCFAVVIISIAFVVGCKEKQSEVEIIELEENTNTDLYIDNADKITEITTAEIEEDTVANNIYEGMSDEEILDLGIEIISNGYFEGISQEKSIGDILKELARVSGSEGTWSGMLDRDSILYMSYDSYDGANYFIMNFTVNTDKSFTLNSITIEDNEVDKNEFLKRISGIEDGNLLSE